MQMFSTDYLKLIAQNNRYILSKRATPRGRLKRDYISIKTNDGRDLVLQTPAGYRHTPVELPTEILDYLLRVSFVTPHGPPDAEGKIIYRLTDEGRRRGLS
jgi:hypothetical protein